VLWDDLNVIEHLLFYSRVKGFPRKYEAAHVVKGNLRIFSEISLGSSH
jgi:hypothetical protein